MSITITVEKLRDHLAKAKDRLKVDKDGILKLYPLGTFVKSEYTFAYLRCERWGMRAINRKLAEVAWLPLQLDPNCDIQDDARKSMKHWLTSLLGAAPSSNQFGNDFIHALARCSLVKGQNHLEFIQLSHRVALLFQQLSCLIGLVYYCTWLSENNVEAIDLTDPDDLLRSAEEIAILLQSPEIYRYLRAQEQDDGPKKQKPAGKPNLRVVEKANQNAD